MFCKAWHNQELEKRNDYLNSLSQSDRIQEIRNCERNTQSYLTRTDSFVFDSVKSALDFALQFVEQNREFILCKTLSENGLAFPQAYLVMPNNDKPHFVAIGKQNNVNITIKFYAET